MQLTSKGIIVFSQYFFFNSEDNSKKMLLCHGHSQAIATNDLKGLNVKQENRQKNGDKSVMV